MNRLETEIAGVVFKNPVMPASGTFEINEYTQSFLDPKKLGALINKTVFLTHRPGNKPPRIAETACGVLNSVGIPSEGIDYFLEHTLPLLKSFGTPLVVSVGGNSVEEFRTISKIVSDTGEADLIELDLSCPNMEDGSIWSAEDEKLYKVVETVKNVSEVPIISKLSPQVSDIGKTAKIAEEAGANAISLINTFPGIKIDVKRRAPLLGNIIGGLSGPAILPLAVYAVWQVYESVDLPIIGMGGISSVESALEMVMAGASVISVGMYNFVDPAIMGKLIDGLETYITANKIESFAELVGMAHSPQLSM
jgi:dihydroorotate dehydrogenase (NAD+) catalytic subunit